MAQRVNIVLIDDLDDSAADETVTFGLDGTTYEIDLNTDNAGRLRDTLAAYVANGRKVASNRRGRRAGVGSGGAGAPTHSAREIRDWARSNGHSVPERGRIPADLREAFELAH
jgi:Lsr2